MSVVVLAVALGGFLIAVGISHFVVPHHYLRLVPAWLPRRRLLVFLSGGLEVILGLGLLIAPTRPSAAVAATALMVLYVLLHVEALARSSAALEWWLDRPAGAAARVVVNLLYVAWAGYVAVAL